MIQSPKKLESSTAFYDAIAKDYEACMTPSDQTIRETVANIFKRVVGDGKVLDFGGGTGLDLPWLINNNYQVFFLEPSPKMRLIAEETVTNCFTLGKPRFVEKTNIQEWSPENLPFSEKMDGVIANFAVLNCMESPAAFFKKIALVCNPQCTVLITVLDPRFQMMYKNYSMLSALRLFVYGKLKILNKHKEVYHETHVHSILSLKNASRGFFSLKFCEPIQSSSFTVLIFSRK
jgi:SAM-dependent methyltransferase